MARGNVTVELDYLEALYLMTAVREMAQEFRGIAMPSEALEHEAIRVKLIEACWAQGYDPAGPNVCSFPGRSR